MILCNRFIKSTQNYHYDNWEIKTVLIRLNFNYDIILFRAYLLILVAGFFDKFIKGFFTVVTVTTSFTDKVIFEPGTKQTCFPFKSI